MISGSAIYAENIYLKYKMAFQTNWFLFSLKFINKEELDERDNETIKVYEDELNGIKLKQNDRF